MANTIRRTQAELSARDKVTFVERTTLFGLLRWWEKVSTERIGHDLVIESQCEIENIYLNGKLIKPKE